MAPLTESHYLKLAEEAFRRIEDALEPVDPDRADYETSGDVLTISFPNGVRCVINTQRPTRQLWVAARSQAWHFSYDEASGGWLDDRGSGMELFELLRRVVAENAGVTLRV